MKPTSKADLSFRLYRKLSDKLKSGDLTEIHEEVKEYCRTCKPSSPMICIERCYIWKFKNERLELSKMLKEKYYITRVYNAIKNERRFKILEILSVQSCNLKEIQQCLKKEGYYHSCNTIKNSYVNPLVGTGLIKKENGRYKLTLYGKKIYVMLDKKFRDVFPVHSSCCEESCLRALMSGPKTYAELTKSLSNMDLRRTMKRLEEKRLVIRNHPSAYVLFFPTNRGSIEKLSPTEKRIFDAILKADGISARKISSRVGITLRRTYKYLNKLKEKKLVLHRRKATTYRLTSKGKEVADYLERIHQFFNREDRYHEKHFGRTLKE